MKNILGGHRATSRCRQTDKTFICSTQFKLLFNSFPQRPDACVCFSQRGCHSTLERTNGTYQSVQGQIHLPCLPQGTVWTHRHTKHNSRLRFCQIGPKRNQFLLPGLQRGGVDGEGRASIQIRTDTL